MKKKKIIYKNSRQKNSPASVAFWLVNACNIK